MNIKTVSINGFHNVYNKTYDFENLNYLYGRNGIGKSTVLQAIQLGLLGYVPGTNKTKQGVMTHANGNMMSVKVVLDDNGNEISIQRIWVLSSGKVTESIEIVPAGYDITALTSALELPLFNFDEFTHMTANGLKDWFINYLPRATFSTDWDKELEEALGDRMSTIGDPEFITECVNAIKEFNTDGVDEIRQANTYFKNQLSFMKSELARKTGTIQSLIHYDDYVAEYTEDELKQMISDAEQRLVDISLKQQMVQRSVSIRKELESLKDAKSLIPKVEEELCKAQLALTTLVDTQMHTEEEYRTLQSEYKSYDSIVNSNGICVFTQKPCGEIASLRDNYVKRRDEISAKMDEYMDKLTEMQKRRYILEAQVKQHRDSINALEYDAKRQKQLETELYSLPETITVDNADKVTEQLETYKDMYGKAVANRKYNELNEIIIQDKYRIESSIECLKLWEKLTGVNGLQAGGDNNPFQPFEDTINHYIAILFNDQTRCKFISTGKANSFSFGIDRRGEYIPYMLLSSGEKCLFVLSLFIGLLDYSESTLRLILIDDFLDHLDDDNFENIFKILNEKTDIQYIFAGVKSINHVKDDSCKIIHIA